MATIARQSFKGLYGIMEKENFPTGHCLTMAI